MPLSAPQIQFRQEFIATFEDGISQLVSCCTRETMVKGNQAVFLVAGSGNAEAVTRGVSGLIPARADQKLQYTATLQEWHDLVRETGFDVFANQGDGRRLMQRTVQSVINRKMDDLIIAELDQATNDTGPAVPASLDTVVWAKTILANKFVNTRDRDNIFGVISPAFEGYLMQTVEYASADYVDMKPFPRGQGPLRWMGVNWIVHPRLTGSVGAGGDGTNELCYMFHRDAIGAAFDVENAKVDADYMSEQDYSWARASIYLGAKLLQNNGIVQMKHDASGFNAQ